MRKRAKKLIRLFDDAVAAEQRHEFQNAKRYYQQIISLHPYSPEADIAGERIMDMDTLSNEKKIYKRIDRNARKILTHIGIDIAASSVLMELLMDADAIDYEREQAHYIPLRKEYLEKCIDMVPTDMREDPGENAFGTGATPPFLLRPGQDDHQAADRAEFE